MTHNLLAVGTGDNDNKTGVVIHFDGATLWLNENLSRKLADDILRNANYLWPTDESEETEKQ